MPSVDFMELVTGVSGVVPSPDFQSRPCPDQWIGSLSSLQNYKEKLTWPRVVRQPALMRPDKPALIVVLESPHRDEYEGDPGPAKGATGRAMAKWLQTVAGSAVGADVPVILMNAVQYQCTLGIRGKKGSRVRDKIFLASWKAFGESDFKVRLDSIYRNGDIVMCCCTVGETKPSLRNHVYRAIEDARESATVLRRMHPASWRFKKAYQKVHDWTPS